MYYYHYLLIFYVLTCLTWFSISGLDNISHNYTCDVYD